MEASVVAPPEEVAVEPSGFDGEAEATRTTEELFEWSDYVHVGGDAATCEHRVDGKCADPKHFHGWVCLPNNFQIRDIDDKARAAEARKIRALRDAGDPATGREPSDSYVTLEAALDMVRDDPDELDRVKDGVVKRTVDKHLPEMIEEMATDERFKHQHQHAEEMRRVVSLPEEERDEEEFEQLKATLREYGDEFQRRVDERNKIERAALDQLDLEQIIDAERRMRIRNIGEEAYLHTYYTWCMYVCTFTPTAEGLPTVRKFPDILTLKSAPPEVVRDLRQKITDLETRTNKRGDAAGNS